MSSSLSCSKIRYIVRIRQMLRRWRKKASRRTAPVDVPSGHVAVAVGSNRRRFVVRTAYLNHPIFKKLLVQAEEEYGFTNTGLLAIPCDESLFENLLRFLALAAAPRTATFEDFQRFCCHGGAGAGIELCTESWPLLYGITGKTVY
ncbi:protein SMALL AUXIN UP-REGULATED RNA 12-like [Andrographis paniculata]|uniref:protein SMALL AUXIN UP-REGULATED RNA 12-like n=1 Tax=Andrographis paniculata TaxID=175694 RepID=UPI0021E8B80F|nr:protein SMALL AUXIN UP-REGULATED RNA 12-like [Andrographis paniculata]